MSYAAVAAAVVGITGTAIGAAKEGKVNKKIDAALAKRKPYQTPDEIFKILNASENKSQGDTITKDFETNQLDSSFANALNTSEMLGADPNSLSTLFGQKVQGLLKVGNDFHASNMESFGNFMNALKIVGDNKAAEQISADNIWKDYMQSLSKQKSDANSTMNSGINAILGSIGTYGTEQLYKNNNKTGSTGGGNFSNTGISGGPGQGGAGGI